MYDDEPDVSHLAGSHAYPKQLNITITSRCNLRCVMCDHAVRKVPKQDFADHLIERAQTHLRSADSIDLTGLGEPLLSPQFWKVLSLFPVTDEAGKDEYKIYFNSNGTQFTEDNIEKILQSGVKRIMVSIDSTDRAMNMAIRGIDPDEIIRGAQTIIERRNARGLKYPLIGFAVTLMKANFKTAGAIVDKCAAIDGDFVEMWSLNSIPEDMAKNWSVALFNYHDQLLQPLDQDMLRLEIDHLHAFAKSLNVPLMTMVLGRDIWGEGFPADDWGKETDIHWKDSSIRCALPWQTQRIDYDGNVFACCWGAKPIGNLNEDTAEDIWRSEQTNSLRKALLDGEVHSHCAGAGCPYM